MNKYNLTVINLPKDGIGSLLEYILGALFYCHTNRISYVHTNPHEIEHNKDISKQDWMKMWNKYIETIFLPNIKDIKDIKVEHEIDINYEIPSYNQQHTLLRITNPGYLKNILNDHIHSRDTFRDYIVNNYWNKTETHDFNLNKINIAVHIRRYMNSDCHNVPWRELYEVGNSSDLYFQNVIKNLLVLLPEAIVHIYSQGDEELYKHYYDISPNVILHLSNNAEYDLIHLIRADILVMSKGSYSRIANFYSKGVKVIREKSSVALTEGTLFIPSCGTLTEKNKKNIMDKLKQSI